MRDTRQMLRMAAPDERENVEGMAGPSTRVLAHLAQLSPDSDKETVIATIDAAVDDLLEQLRSHDSGGLDKSFLEQTQQTIVFLEACTGFPDPAFTGRFRGLGGVENSLTPFRGLDTVVDLRMNR